MKITTKYDMWQFVYVASDPDQLPRQIIGIAIQPTGLLYCLKLGTEESDHYEQELTAEEDQKKKLGLNDN